MHIVELPTQVITRNESEEELMSAREKPRSSILFDNMLQRELAQVQEDRSTPATATPATTASNIPQTVSE